VYDRSSPRPQSDRETALQEERLIPPVPVILSLVALLAVPGGGARTAGAPLERSRLEAAEELTESLAGALVDLSVAARRRDMARLGGFFPEDLSAEPFPSRPGPTTRELKWILHHSWEPAPAADAPGPVRPIGRTELLAQIEAFLTHFSVIEDVRFNVEAATFGAQSPPVGEARASFHVVGRDSEGRKEWARGTLDITAIRGPGETWRITRLRAGPLGSDLAEVDLFSEVSRPAGLARSIPAFGVTPSEGFISHGGAAADVDGDGLIDLIVTRREGVSLYLNDGKGAFRDASEETLIAQAPAATGALPLDYDNDGDLDIFLSVLGRQCLLENRLRPTGLPRFFDVSDEAGVSESAVAFSAAAADVNGDGRPDIYVTSYNRYGLVMPNSWGHATNGTPNLLFVNQGGGRFVEDAHRWGVDDGRWSLAAAFADVDGDGRQDLFVANDFGEDALFMNHGDRFTDEAAARGVRGPGNGMGAAFGDFDNDGDLDLHVTNMSSIAGTRVLDRVGPEALRNDEVLRKLASGNTLYANDGTGRFTDVTEAAGRFRAGWAWGGGFLDFDNDGLEDEFSVNGFISGSAMDDTSSLFWRHVVAADAGLEEAGNPGYRRNHMGRIMRGGMSFSGYERDGLYLALGGGKYRDLSGISSVDSITDGRGAAFADFDNDGDLDIFATTVQRIACLLHRNEVGQDGSFLRVTLEGGRSGRDAFGAVARIKTPLGIQSKIKAGGWGFLSSHDPRLLFGLGDGAPIEWLEVTWPSGARQRFTGARAGESLLIHEDSGRLERVAEKRFRLVDPDGPVEAACGSLGLARGRPLPAIALVRPSGERVKLSRVPKPGRRTLLSFWATWCAPCRRQMRELGDMSGGLEKARIDLVGISLDFGEVERVRAFVEEQRIEFPVYVVDDASVGMPVAGGDPSMPFSLLVDESGAVVNALTGWSEATRRSLESLAGGG
jgi:thiol-disulfide isomerase/thioredoxin